MGPRSSFLRIASVFVIVQAAVPALYAAHLFAAMPGAIKVYDVAASGTLTLRQTLAVDATLGAVSAMSITPGGRFLYTGHPQGWIQEWAVQGDGHLLKWGPPVRDQALGISELAMHPSGDYLYAMEIPLYSIWRTADSDGTLSLLYAAAFGEDGPVALMPDPLGRNLQFTAATIYGPSLVDVAQLDPANPQSGHFVGRFYDGGEYTQAAATDGRYVYVSTSTICDIPYQCGEFHHPITFTAMAIAADGSLKVAFSSVSPSLVVKKMLPFGGHFLAMSAGGPGSRLEVFDVGAVGTLGLQGRADVPIEVYGLAADKAGSRLWVATDDGLVTYRVNGDGSLVRVSKAFVNGVTAMAYGIK